MNSQPILFWVSTASGIATVALTALSFYSTIYKPVRPARGTRLGHRTYNDTQLVDPAHSGETEWLLEYKDRFSQEYCKAPNPMAALVGIRNNGATTIGPEDFDEPITITFKNRNVLKVQVVEPGDALINKPVCYKKKGELPKDPDLVVDQSGEKLDSEPPEAV